MKNKSKLIVIIGVFIILIFVAVIYNYQPIHTLNQQCVVLQNKDSMVSSSPTRLPDAPNVENQFAKIRGILEAKIETPSQTNHKSIQPGLSNPKNDTLVTHVQKKIGQNIENKDLVAAGLIIMRKLSAEDISYLSKVAMKDSYSREDYRKSQEILLNKLSTNEIDVLKKLGKKYGLNTNL